MKKFIPFVTAIVLPFTALGGTATSQLGLNQQTLNSMIQIQQQQTQLQQQLLSIQQNMLSLEKQQLMLQKRLFIQSTQATSQNFKWVTNSNVIPANRINAGLTEGPEVYICHAQYQNLGVHPGTLTPSGCLISYAGRAYLENQYQVLTGTGKIRKSVV